MKRIFLSDVIPTNILRFAKEVWKAFLIGFLIYQGASCGKKQGHIDPEFEQYVKDFESRIGVRVLGMNIKFGSLQSPYIGMCAIGGSMNEITIDPVFWVSTNEYGRDLLIYHELGHCALYLGHDDSRAILDGISVEGSIMNTYWFGDRPYYRKYRDRYKDALRTQQLVNGSRVTPMTYELPVLVIDLNK